MWAINILPPFEQSELGGNCLKVEMQKIITRANHFKFLGVLLDETLSWKFELSRKLSRSLGIFLQIAPKETLKNAYYSLLYPFLSYGILVWGATHEKYSKPALFLIKKLLEQ